MGSYICWGDVPEMGVVYTTTAIHHTYDLAAPSKSGIAQPSFLP